MTKPPHRYGLSDVRAPRDPITGQLKKGSRLNPSGRSGSRAPLWALLDQLLGENATEAYIFAANVMRGQVQVPARKPHPGEDAASVALIPSIGPSVRERLDAAVWLAEQRNGKAPSSASIDVQGAIALPVVRIDPGKLTDEELERLEALALKALDSGGNVVDGEIVHSETTTYEPH